MIAELENGLSVSLEVGRCVLAFASENPNRPSTSVGIDKGELCSTDGLGLVRFLQPEGLRLRGEGRYWMRAYVEQQVKAAGRVGPVLLEWERQERGFVPCWKAEPLPGAPERIAEPMGVDTRLLGRLEMVARACRRERNPGEKITEPPPLPVAVLLSLGGPLDPFTFTITAAGLEGYAHEARVTIMPMRLGSYVAPKVKPKRARKSGKGEVAA